MHHPNEPTPIPRSLRRAPPLAAACILALAAVAGAQTEPDLSSTSNPQRRSGTTGEIDPVVAAMLYRISWDALDQRSEKIQTETPSMAANSTVLADGTGISEFLSVALNLAGLSGSTKDADEPTSASATVTLLALGQATCGFLGCSDDLDENRRGRLVQNLRNVGLTLGFDGDEGDSERAILYGVRWKLDALWKRLPDDAVPGGTGTEAATLTKDRYLARRMGIDLGGGREGAEAAGRSDVQRAVAYFGGIAGEAADRESGALEAELRSFREEQLRAAMRSASRGAGGRLAFGGRESGDEITARQHAETIVSAVREAENMKWSDALSAALDFMGRDGKESENDRYTAKLNLDYTPREQDQATVRLNGGFMYEDIPSDEDAYGGEAALELQYRFTRDAKTAGRAPIQLAFSGMAQWLMNEKDQYAGQAKLTIPLFNGVTLPISVTVANRTELVDETNVRGLVGFSIDTSRLVELFKPGA